MNAESPARPGIPVRAMRITFVTYSFGWGGTEKHLEQLVTRLAPARAQPTIVCFGPPVYRESLNARYSLQIPVVDYPRARSFGEFHRALRATRPDVVVFVNGKLGLFPWQAYLAARLSGARRVIAIEHLQGEPPPPPATGQSLRAAARRAAGWRTRYMLGIRACGYLATRTVCVSNAVRDRVVNEYGYPPSRTLVVVNGIDTAFFTPSGRDRRTIRAELRVNPAATLIVCVARLGRLKRIDVLLDAVAQLRRSRPDIACVVIGDGPLHADLERRAAVLGLGETVQFAGHHDDVRAYLEAGDLYLSTSDQEGFGLAVAEAMSMGLPCIVTNIGGHDEMVIHGQTGLLVPPGSPAAVAEAVEFLLDDAALRASIARAGQARVHERFALDAMVSRYDAVFSGRSPAP